MKKSFLQFCLVLLVTSSFAQIKTTGLIDLDPKLKAEITINETTSLVSLTLIGPLDRWFSLGFNTELMLIHKDCVVLTAANELTDAYFSGGHVAPVADLENNWTIQSNSTDATTRTVIASRPISTNDINDYDFSMTPSTLNLIWAYNYTNDFDFVYHGENNFGGAVATFSTLSVYESQNINGVFVYPNPVRNKLMVNLNGITAWNCEIELINSIGQIVYTKKEVVSNEKIEVETSTFQEGLYYLKLNYNSVTLVKKVSIVK